MLRRPGKLVVKHQAAEETLAGIGRHCFDLPQPILLPSHITITSVCRYFAFVPNSKHGKQWGLKFEHKECIGHQEPPLELLGFINILPPLVHV